MNGGGAVEDEIRPFEWLTSSESLDPIVRPLLDRNKNKRNRILHVGCGSSTWGEHVAQAFPTEVDWILNIDKDQETLDRMEQRWNCQQDERVRYQCVDFGRDRIENVANGSVHVVLDKSTLDCTLCSDEATAGLLCEVYRLLSVPSSDDDDDDGGGTYVVVSFHHLDLLLPLLRDCPGADWTVTHHVIRRQVEDLIRGDKTVKNRQTNDELEGDNNKHLPSTNQQQESSTLSTAPTRGTSVWSNGTFQPTEEYRRTVNVLLCRRRSNGSSDAAAEELDRLLVQQHIHETNDAWYRNQNPILSANRIETIRKSFQQQQQPSLLLPLPECYQTLFTDEEREHLTYEYFLQDWDAFWENHKDTSTAALPKDCMSLATALEFLQEMQ